MASRTRRGGSGPWKGRAVPDLDLRRLEESVLGPPAARTEGFEVRQAVNRQKQYRCPFCQGWITPGTKHTVALPTGRPEDRRHYHAGCWARQAKAGRGGGSY